MNLSQIRLDDLNESLRNKVLYDVSKLQKYSKEIERLSFRLKMSKAEELCAFDLLRYIETNGFRPKGMKGLRYLYLFIKEIESLPDPDR